MRPKEVTKLELQRDISQIGLQAVYCGLFAGILQVFTVYLQVICNQESIS